MEFNFRFSYFYQNLEFDVISILNADDREGPAIVRELNDATTPVTATSRQSIIRITLAHLCRQLGGPPKRHLYPKSSTKEKLAISIVKAFPQMGLSRPGIPSHAWIYNAASGNAFIDQRLKRMRDLAPADQRKRKSGKDKTVAEKVAQPPPKGKKMKTTLYRL